MQYSNVYESFRHSWLALTGYSTRSKEIVTLKKQAREFCRLSGENYKDLNKFVFC